MFEILQGAHLLVFLFLIVLPEWKRPGKILLASAAVYLILNSTVGRGLVQDSYLFDAVFDFSVATALIRYGGKVAKPQALLLSLFTIIHALAWIEFPTNYSLMYQSYATLTIGLNILQLVVVWYGVRKLLLHLLDEVAFNGRVAYGLLLENRNVNQRLETG